MHAGARLILLLCLSLPAQVFAQKTVEVRLGEWRASYSLYTSPGAVCDAEPRGLADELANRLNERRQTLWIQTARLFAEQQLVRAPEM